MLHKKIQDLENQMQNLDTLEYEDIYGSPTNNAEKPWSLDDVVKKHVMKSLKLYSKIEKELEEDENLRSIYEHDAKELKTRTVDYLKKVGLIEKESDIERLVVANKSKSYSGDISVELKKIEDTKESLNHVQSKMIGYRRTLQGILDKMSEA